MTPRIRTDGAKFSRNTVDVLKRPSHWGQCRQLHFTFVGLKSLGRLNSVVLHSNTRPAIAKHIRAIPPCAGSGHVLLKTESSPRPQLNLSLGQYKYCLTK